MTGELPVYPSKDGIYKGSFSSFYGGIPDDLRITSPEFGQLAQHLDIFTNPKRLTPFRTMVADSTNATNVKLFEYANALIYGIGGVTSSSFAVEIYNKTSLGGNWTASTGANTGGTHNGKFFKHFHNYLYYPNTTGPALRYYGDITSGGSETNSTATNTTNVVSAQGIVTKDDLLLVPCGNVIARKNGAGSGPTDTWTQNALVLPTDQYITDLCEYGDVVAIGIRSVFPGGSAPSLNSSKVHLWDKANVDISQTIDFGDGDLILLENLEGTLYAVINVGGQSSFGNRPKLVIRKWDGGSKATVVKELQGDEATALTIYGNWTKMKDNNRLIFAATMTINGVAYNQLMSFGRKTPEYPLALQFDRLPNNDTALTGNIDGAAKFGDFVFTSLNGAGTIMRTNNSITFTAVTPTYFTSKITGEAQVRDSHRKEKTLHMAGILCPVLVSGQTLSLYYRINGATAWSLIRTYSWVSGQHNMGFEAGVDANGDPIPNFHEIELKATTSGGAEITDIIYAWKFAGSAITSE